MKRPRSKSTADFLAKSASHFDAPPRKRLHPFVNANASVSARTLAHNVFGPDSDSDSDSTPANVHQPAFTPPQSKLHPSASAKVLNPEPRAPPVPQRQVPQSHTDHNCNKSLHLLPRQSLLGNDANPNGVFDFDTDSHESPIRAPEQGQISKRQQTASSATILFGSSPERDNANEPQPPNQAKKLSTAAPEEDSLDIFMNTLSSARARPNPRTLPKSPSSDSDSSAPPAASALDSTTLLYCPSPEAASRAADAKRRSLTLPSVHHSSIFYPPIRKALYTPLARQTGFSSSALAERLNAARVSISGPGEPVCPISSFVDVALALPRALLSQLLSLFDAPTPVQRAALPAALAGHDVLATADTGSGKTLAFLVPLLAHARAQSGGAGSSAARGPRVFILAPTRELAAQIGREARRFAAPLGLGVALVTGGTGKFEQFRMLRDSGARVLVATPGRLIDMLKMRACSLQTVSALAVDEADRMLDLGFGRQVASLLGQVRPDAQRLLFSATLPDRVRRLAAAHLNDPVHIAAIGAAAASAATAQPMVCAGVRERYVVLDEGRERWEWLRAQIPSLVRDGLVIVFCRTRGGCAALANRVRAEGVAVACIHGETEQGDRTGLLRLFKEGDVRVLVTTDLAARGLDIAEVRSVVNYEAAKDWEWHVHRVGRTGRAERTGNAYTLLCRDSGADCSFVEKAVDAFGKVDAEPPEELLSFPSTCRRSR